MFHGSIPQDMRNILNEVAATWDVSDIYVGCSGNFTVERVLATRDKFRIHSNDVTIYSGAIGAFLAGQPFRLELKPEAAERFGWLAPFLDTPSGKTAVVMLATKMLDALRSDGSVKDNAYYRRMLPAYEAQFARMHAATAAKLEALPIQLASYHNGDVVPWVKQIDRSAGFISYPPFFSGDYESMFHKLELLFAWDKPAYEEIGEAHVNAFLDAIVDRPCWLFGSNRKHPAYERWLTGRTQTTNRGVPIYVYASKGVKRIVVPAQETTPVNVPRLMPGETIGAKLRIAKLNQGQFQALRSQYMNAGIKPGPASEAFAVLVDDQLIDVYALSVAPTDAQLETPSNIYMLSDFPVAPSDYPRLAKLVLIAALSQESKLLCERLARRRVRFLYTTAFSNNPVSMKYRGLFDLHNRKQNPGWDPARADDPDAYYQLRYTINYKGTLGAWSLAEGMALWQQKHGKRLSPAKTSPLIPES